MTLTLKLGFRYLWVDRHYIDQKNEANKAKELAIMDHIYENATLTIVGMAGADDASGLPGIRTQPIVSRNEQPQAVFSRAHTCFIEPGSFDFGKKIRMVNSSVDIPRSSTVEVLSPIHARSGLLLM